MLSCAKRGELVAVSMESEDGQVVDVTLCGRLDRQLGQLGWQPLLDASGSSLASESDRLAAHLQTKVLTPPLRPPTLPTRHRYDPQTRIAHVCTSLKEVPCTNLSCASDTQSTRSAGCGPCCTTWNETNCIFPLPPHLHDRACVFPPDTTRTPCPHLW